MQYLFECWEVLRRRLEQAGHIFLSVDFDGTVAPIKPRPKEAELPENTRLLLRRISRSKAISFAIVTGRALKDIKEKAGLKQVIFAAEHGLEINYRGGCFLHPEAKRFVPVIAKISKKLTKKLQPFPEAILEKKRLTLSLHYRLVKKEDLLKLKAVFFQNTRPYQAAGKIKFTSGKKVWEVRPPVDWDKGKAVLWLRQRLKQKKALAVYIGDDLTDEDAFRAVNKIGGISILAGRKRKNSFAGYYLKSAKDVQRFLQKIVLIKC